MIRVRVSLDFSLRCRKIVDPSGMHYSVRCGHRGLRPMAIVARLCFMFMEKRFYDVYTASRTRSSPLLAIHTAA